MNNLITPKFVLILGVIFFGNNYTKAQNLPQKQDKSVYAPVDIKVDGKITESESYFQAFNKVNRIFYTISNDNTNLYLTICTKDAKASQKILYGGLTFSIKAITSTKEKLKDVLITYPAIESKLNHQHDNIVGAPRRYNQMKKDAVAPKKLSDLIALTNQQLTNFYKEIQISGIKDIDDPVISVYNNIGIKASVLFNEKMECNYELKIPLQYVTSKINSNGTLKYNIRLNGEPTITSVQTLAPPSGPSNNQDGEMLYLYSPTDFSGEYTLAKQ